MRRLLVTGSRLGWRHEELRKILRQAFVDLSTTADPIVMLMHGGAQGVDRQAASIWMAHGLPLDSHPALWALEGKAAGPLRNQRMVDLGADLCIGFVRGEGRGTRDCLTRAEAAGIKTEIHYWKERP